MLPTEGGTRGRGKMRRLRVGWRLARTCGQELLGDNVGMPTLNVDHPCVPVVNDGKFRTDLFVTTCPWSTRPG